jgi:hypothetical protein
MIGRITKLDRLRKSEWLGSAALRQWTDIKAPDDSETKSWGIQELELSSPISFESFKLQFATTFQANKNKDATESDGVLAAELHKLLHGLTLREARDPRLWAYLAVFGAPKYVRWRWPDKVGIRYSGTIRRNALARLWWWAELTHDQDVDLDEPERYRGTLHTARRSDFVLYVGDCAFSGSRELLRHLSDVQLKQAKTSKHQQKFCRAVNRLARVTCLDSLAGSNERQAFCNRALTVSESLS